MQFELVFALIATLLFTVLSFSLGMLVLFNAKTKAQYLWAFFNFVVGSWGIGFSSSCLARDPESALLAFRLSAPFGAMIAAVFMHFVYEICGLKNKIPLIITDVVCGAIAIGFLTRYVHYDIRLHPIGIYYARPTDWTYPCVFISWNIVVLMGHYFLFKAIQSSSGDKQIEYRYILVAMMFGFTGGSVSHFGTVYGFKFAPLVCLLISVYNLLGSYGLFRHKLIGIDLVVRRSLLYTLLISCLTVIYFGVIGVLGNLIGNFVFGPVNVLGVLPIVLLALFVEPLRVRLNGFVDKYFFKGTLVEISTQKDKLEEELKRQERLKSVGILASGMAHEIKNPLAAINTFVEYLPEKYDDPKFREDFQRILKSETGRIKDILQDLLAFSKPKPPQKVPTDLNKLIQDILTLLSNDLLKNKITLSFNPDSTVNAALLDPSQMKQALLNIILNAIDAMKDKEGQRTLTVTTSKDNQKTLITLEDTGIGIDPDKLPYLFDPFYSSKKEGTGLGLAITHAIIQQHGGVLTAKSSRNVGTSFEITLF